MKEYSELMTNWHQRYPHLRAPTRHAIDTLNNYVKTGNILDGFIVAMLANDLKKAVERADNENINTIPSLVVYMKYELPPISWGHYDNIDDWQERIRINSNDT